MASKKKKKVGSRKKVVRKKAARRVGAKKKVVRKKATRKKAARRVASVSSSAGAVKPRKKAKRRRNPAAAAAKTASRPSPAIPTPKGQTRSYAKRSLRRARRYTAAVNYSKKHGYKLPTEKSRVVLKAGFPMSKRRRAKYIREGKLSARGHANPPKRGKSRKNPASRRKNPSLMGCFEQLWRANFWISGAQAVGGVSAVVLLPSVIEQIASRAGMGSQIRNSGGTGVLLSAVSTALATCGAQVVESFAADRGMGGKVVSGLASRVALGGALVTAIRALEVFANQFHNKLGLPNIPAPVLGLPGMSAAPVAAPAVNGMGDFLQLSGMGGSYGAHGVGNFLTLSGGGMGNMVSPEALVAGESYARSVSQFHGMGDMLPAGSIPSGSLSTWQPSALETF